MVSSGDLFQFTTHVLSKFVPLTVSVKPDPPTIAEEGLTLAMVGTAAGAITENVTDPDDDPPGLITMTLNEPLFAIKLAGTDAVN